MVNDQINAELVIKNHYSEAKFNQRLGSTQASQRSMQLGLFTKISPLIYDVTASLRGSGGEGGGHCQWLELNDFCL